MCIKVTNLVLYGIAVICPVCRMDERAAKCRAVSVTTVNKSEEKTEMKGSRYMPPERIGLQNMKEM